MKLDTNENIELLKCSDERYDALTIEIRYLGEPIAQINQDQGQENLIIEVFTNINDLGFAVQMPLADFQKALQIAADALVNPGDLLPEN